MAQRIWSSKLLFRKDHEKHILGVATRIAHLHGELGLISDPPDMEELMGMTLQQLFGMCDLDLQPHPGSVGAFMTWMDTDDLTRGFETILKELAPLLRVGSRYVLYDADDEDNKIEYTLSKGRIWLLRTQYKVIFTGKGTPL